MNLDQANVVDTHTGAAFLPDAEALAEAQKIVAALRAAGQDPTPQAIVAMMATRNPDTGVGPNPYMAPVNPAGTAKSLASSIATKKKVVAFIYEDFTWELV